MLNVTFNVSEINQAFVADPQCFSWCKSSIEIFSKNQSTEALLMLVLALVALLCQKLLSDYVSQWVVVPEEHAHELLWWKASASAAFWLVTLYLLWVLWLQ